MLALATGWTPDVLGSLPGRFRAACHWALYGQTISGPEGLPNTEKVPGQRMTPELAKRAVHIADLRTLLFPEGD